jgi:sulfatase modifying factor 1
VLDWRTCFSSSDQNNGDQTKVSQNNADQNTVDRKGVESNDSGQNNVDEKHDDNARLAGTKAGEERSFGELQMKFCWCPAGKFTMGSPADEAGRFGHEDQVDVTLTQGFWLGKTEVTQGQWKAVMSTTPWKGESYVKEDSDCPAVYVSWEDAMSFCQKLTEKERSAGRLPRDWEYTLPTEAQWEYACRAGTRTRYNFGDDADELGRYALCKENTFKIGEKYAHEVGKKLPNPWQLHDMHGNVFEWCRDWYAKKLPGGNNPEVTTKGSYRVSRGGGWRHSAWLCRSALRNWFVPSSRSSNGHLGFRVAAVPSSK